MKNTNRVPVASRQHCYAPAPETEISARVKESPYDEVDPEEGIEYFTVREFLRLAPFRVNTDQFKQFGREVGYSAEAMHLVYLTKVDPEYGPTRAFPMTLFVRVYKVMALKLGWPKFVAPADQIEDEAEKARQALKANERAARVVESLTERVDSVDVLDALELIRGHLKADSERLRVAVEAPPPITA